MKDKGKKRNLAANQKEENVEKFNIKVGPSSTFSDLHQLINLRDLQYFGETDFFTESKEKEKPWMRQYNAQAKAANTQVYYFPIEVFDPGP